MPKETKTRRHLGRWSLRSLLLAMTIACLGLAYLSYDTRRIDRLRQEMRWRNWTVEASVSLEDETDHRLFATFCNREAPTTLTIWGHFTESDILSVARLQDLTELWIEVATLTPNDIRDLRGRMPNCQIHISHMEPPSEAEAGNPTIP